MNIWSELSKLTLKDLSLGLLNLFFLISPGFLIFFLFDKDLFLRLDITRLIILSLAIIAPFIIVNFFFFQSNEKSLEKTSSSFTYIVLATFTSVLVLDLSLLVKYLFGTNTKVFIAVAILTQIIALVILNWIHRPEKTS